MSSRAEKIQALCESFALYSSFALLQRTALSFENAGAGKDALQGGVSFVAGVFVAGLAVLASRHVALPTLGIEAGIFVVRDASEPLCSWIGNPESPRPNGRH
jgi:hypothetical protein